MYAQWFHQYETSEEVLSLILRTYASVFDHVALWYTMSTDLLLLGFMDDSTAFDLERLERRAARPDFAAGLQRAGVDSFPALLAHEVVPLGVLWPGRALASHAAAATTALVGFYLFLAPGVLLPEPLEGTAATWAGRLWVAGVFATLTVSGAWLAGVLREGYLGAHRTP